MDIRKLIRRHILDLQPYSSARNEYTGAGGILLDANENAFGPVIPGTFNRYPDPLQKELKQLIAQQKNIASERIFLGNGSDEPIDLLIRAFCEPARDEILIFPPTYGMYQVCAGINDVPVREIPLRPDFSLSRDGVSAAALPAVKLVFLCSPNNPTGNLFTLEDIIPLITDHEWLVVVDEAYIDFSETRGCLDLIAAYDNLVILQTLSKSWGLAGIRLGMAFGHPDVISVLNKIKYPYNINTLTQSTALQALRHSDVRQDVVRKIIAQRDVLINGLKGLKIVRRIFPSQANFILVRFTDARSVFSYLMENNVIVRDRSRAVHCENCLRITVGTPSENIYLLDLLQKYKG